MSNSHEKFLNLLQDFKAITVQQKNLSIFDVAGYPHYENVCSNILSFYLNPNNEHGLGDLFFSSLMELVGKSAEHQENVQVSREVSTKKGGRLDIVIESDDKIVGIENKIYHQLNNDFKDYSLTIDNWAKVNGLETTKIVLSIKKEPDITHGFVSVTHEDLLKKIKEKIGIYVAKSNPKWICYLTDYMNTMEKLCGGKMELDANDRFFIENEIAVNELLNARNQFVSKLQGLVRELSVIVGDPSDGARQWIYSKTCLVHDYKLSGNSIAFDLYVSPNGWKLQLLGRNAKSREYMGKLLSHREISKMEIPLKDNRYQLREFELSTPLPEIADVLKEWFKLLTEAEKSLNGES